MAICRRALAALYSCVVPQPAQQERDAEHEEQVGDDRASDRRLDELEHAHAQRGQRNDKLGEIAKARVQKAADAVARLGGDRFGGAAEERGQRNDGSDRKDEKRVCACGGMLCNDHRWREDEKPQDRLVSQLLRDSVHPECSFTCAR